MRWVREGQEDIERLCGRSKVKSIRKGGRVFIGDRCHKARAVRETGRGSTGCFKYIPSWRKIREEGGQVIG